MQWFEGKKKEGMANLGRVLAGDLRVQVVCLSQKTL